MGEANISRQALLQALSALELQREHQPESEAWQRALATAMTALLEKLSEAEPATTTPDGGRRLAVLVADLSGFTSLSEGVDAERVREALNAMWRELDGVVVAWGGRIDQHAGDSLVALFGRSRPRAYDAACALHAALAMQMELSLFNRRVADPAATEAGSDRPATWRAHWPAPQMRIGVHSGKVFFAEGAAGHRPTAIGETIEEARQIEQSAPPGGILISAAVRAAVGPTFATAPMDTPSRGRESSPAEAADRLAEPPMLLLGESGDGVGWAPDFITGRQTRLVGRASELDRLSLAFQQAIDSRSIQVVILAGPPGLGKARLLHEFDERLRLFGDRRVLLRGSGTGLPVRAPFGVLRELVARYFGVRPAHSDYVIAEKLRLGLVAATDHAGGGSASALSSEDVEQIHHLLSGDGAMLEALTLARSTRRLLQTLAADAPALMLINQTDDVDEGTLEVIDEWLAEPDGLPLMIVCNLEDEPPAAVTARFDWLTRSDDPFSHQMWLDVAPLSPIDSRLLAADILSPLAPPPMRLIDLLVAESRGNPLYIQGLAQLMMEAGIIQTGARWQVDMAMAEALRLPMGLEELLRLRLGHLSQAERLVLQAASAVGTVFWDETLRALDLFEDERDGANVDEALTALVARRLIRPHDSHHFSDCQAFTFSRPLLRRLAYDELSPRHAVAYHQAIASWFVARQRRGLGPWLPAQEIISWQLAQAGQRDTAAA